VRYVVPPEGDNTDLGDVGDRSWGATAVDHRRCMLSTRSERLSSVIRAAIFASVKIGIAMGASFAPASHNNGIRASETLGHSSAELQRPLPPLTHAHGGCERHQITPWSTRALSWG
jgi:hypothetical protein